MFGWGGIWTVYGFDEKIWKHIFFPCFVKKGDVSTWIRFDANIFNNLKSDTFDINNPAKIDYNFTSKYTDNEFIQIT
jgi:hypothetical protein